jgi:leucine dehydrogenase
VISPTADLLRDWDGDFVVIRRDAPTGATVTIAVHRSRPEAASGGTRMRHYDAAEEALADALRLAGGMSIKFALLDLPRGGGKAVLDIPPDLDQEARSGLLDRYADLVDRLGGVFQTGPDLGTTRADMDRMATRTPHVFGTSRGAGDSGPGTALGVLSGIRACLAHRTGSDSLEGRRVLVQGLGGVGRPLAASLARNGAQVLCADLRPEARDAHREYEWVDPEAVPDTPCDVYSPCAAGGILNATTIPRLRCTIVAGSANNQLAEPGDAARLHGRGILYAPDVAISGGGALKLVGAESLGWSPEKIETRILGLGDLLLGIFRAAERDDVTPHEAALQLARSRLSAAERAPIARHDEETP